MTRTHDLLITNQLLYRLSYSSLSTCTRGDIEITNQLLYRLSYSSISYENWLFRHTLFLVYHTLWLLKRNSLTTTGDLLITNQLLYQLSYTSICNFRVGIGSL